MKTVVFTVATIAIYLVAINIATALFGSSDWARLLGAAAASAIVVPMLGIFQRERRDDD